MIRVLAARVAKLGELETSCRGLLVLGGRVVPVLAHRTLQADDLAHTLLLTWPATSAGKQLVQNHFRHAATQGNGPCNQFLIVTERGAVRPRSSLSIIYQNPISWKGVRQAY